MHNDTYSEILPGTVGGLYRGRTVILADGDFPAHPLPLEALASASRVVCCDAAAVKLLAYGREPTVIAGDLDSLPPELRQRYADILAHDASQETNDLTKAFHYCQTQGWRDLVVLGATGGREDHALGNLSLLVDYAVTTPEIVLLSDHGLFRPLHRGGRIATQAGQQVSLFAFEPGTAIRATGLRWPLEGLRLNRWWQATLNQALADEISLDFSGGPLLLYLAYGEMKSTKHLV